MVQIQSLPRLVWKLLQITGTEQTMRGGSNAGMASEASMFSLSMSQLGSIGLDLENSLDNIIQVFSRRQ